MVETTFPSRDPVVWLSQIFQIVFTNDGEQLQLPAMPLGEARGPLLSVLYISESLEIVEICRVFFKKSWRQLSKLLVQGCHAFTEWVVFSNLWIGKDHSSLIATAMSIYYKITSLLIKSFGSSQWFRSFLRTMCILHTLCIFHTLRSLHTLHSLRSLRTLRSNVGGAQLVISETPLGDHRCWHLSCWF
jgi:hypothetical protein